MINNNESIYTTLCVLFSVLIVVGNLIYQKFVFLPLFPFYTFELSVGAILYPLTFLLTDLITEFYGREKASFCVRLAIFTNIFVALLIAGMDQLEATPWSNVDRVIFHKVFGFYSVAFIGSVIACYVSQLIDIKLYLWIRKITKGKWLWARNNGSTLIALFVDTCIVVSFMTLFQVISLEHMGSLILNSFVFKSLFVILSTPLFYLAVNIIQKRPLHKGVGERE